MRVSVVIASYSLRRLSALSAAVESVRRQTRPALEILIVVDRNPDLLDRVRREFLDCRSMPNDEAPGAGGARNVGARAALGSVVAFLDDDAEATPAWIENIIGGLADPHVLGVGGEVMARWLAPRPRWFPDEFGWVVGCSYRGQPEGVARIRNLMAGNMAVRRNVFVALGGYRQGNTQFDVDDGHAGSSRFSTRDLSCEETEMCIRASREHPHSFWLFDPAVAIEHRVSAERTTLRYFLSRCHDEGIAKATMVVGNVGTRDGLAAEREYVRRILPGGIGRGLWESVSRRDVWAAARAGMIGAGLAATVAGYGRGRLAACATRICRTEVWR